MFCCPLASKLTRTASGRGQNGEPAPPGVARCASPAGHRIYLEIA